MKDNLDNWRKQIDVLDEKILIHLAKRMNISSKIGRFKKERGISTLDKKRWGQVLKSNLKQGGKLGFSREFINDLLKLIHKYSLEVQEKN